jgi:hypothetical protein
VLTVVYYWILASYVIGLGLAADQLRRPLADWEAAGRERRFWLGLSLVMGFHGLGEYAAIAYFVGVLPRFRGTGPTLSQRVMRRAGELGRSDRRRSVNERLVFIAAALVLASSCIHAAVIADHFKEYWLFGAFFAVVTIGQAAWSALVYRNPLNQRLLVAGAAGNALLVVVWAISRTLGVPFGPGAWTPETIGAADVLSTLDELAAVALIAVVVARLRGVRLSMSRLHIRLASMVSGPLFINSLMAAFGGGHHH